MPQRKQFARILWGGRGVYYKSRFLSSPKRYMKIPYELLSRRCGISEVFTPQKKKRSPKKPSVHTCGLLLLFCFRDYEQRLNQMRLHWLYSYTAHEAGGHPLDAAPFFSTTSRHTFLKPFAMFAAFVCAPFVLRIILTRAMY